MRHAYLLLAAMLIVGCNQSPQAESFPTDNRALHPSSEVLGYTDAQVEAMRAKLASMSYPKAAGETVKSLGIERDTPSTLRIDEYKPNSKNLLAAYHKTYVLNSRYELAVVEYHTADTKVNSVNKVEQSASIQPIKR